MEIVESCIHGSTQLLRVVFMDFAKIVSIPKSYIINTVSKRDETCMFVSYNAF